jgi:hypothetical protein
VQVYAQQDQIDAQRSRVTQEADAAERACNESFAVTDCVKKVQARQRQQLAEIKREETTLHDVQRKEQAAEQARQTAEKRAQYEQQVAQASAATADTAQRKQEQEDKRRQHGEMAANAVKAPNTGASRPAPPDAKNYRSEWERKQQEADKKRLDRNRRMQEKANAKAVPGLPTAPP